MSFERKPSRRDEMAVENDLLSYNLDLDPTLVYFGAPGENGLY